MKVTVVGAGLIGLASAYRLAGRGAEVTVVYRSDLHTGASNINAGFLVPGDCSPLPGPGVVLQAMKWMVSSGSPLYVRPSLSPTYLGFLFGMFRASNAKAFRTAVANMIRLADGTLEEFDAWAADGIAFETHRRGELRVFLTDEEFEGAVGGLEPFRRAGYEIQELDGNATRDLVPQLRDEVRHGIYYPRHRHVMPGAVVNALLERTRAMGVRFVEDDITAATVRGDGVELRGSKGAVQSDAVVLAAATGSRALGRLFGAKLPIHAGKGYAVDYQPGQLPADVPHIIPAEAHCAITPLDGGTRVGGTMEFGSLDERISAARVRALKAGPTRYFRDWNPDAPSTAPLAGLRPMAPDGLPVIGRLGGHRNVVVATGHAMMGLTLAPVTAKLVASMVIDGASPEAAAPFSPSRFG